MSFLPKNPVRSCFTVGRAGDVPRPKGDAIPRNPTTGRAGALDLLRLRARVCAGAVHPQETLRPRAAAPGGASEGPGGGAGSPLGREPARVQSRAPRWPAARRGTPRRSRPPCRSLGSSNAPLNFSSRLRLPTPRRKGKLFGLGLAAAHSGAACLDGPEGGLEATVPGAKSEMGVPGGGFEAGPLRGRGGSRGVTSRGGRPARRRPGCGSSHFAP